MPDFTVHYSAFSVCRIRASNGHCQNHPQTFRTERGLKQALRMPIDHRSIANMVEVMIRDYCGRNSNATKVLDGHEMKSFNVAHHSVTKKRGV